MSLNIKPFLFVSIGVLLFSFGCATRHHEIITAPPKPVQEPAAPPKQETEPQPAAPAPEKTEQVKEPAPQTPAAPEPQAPATRSAVPNAEQTGKSAPRAVASLRLTEQARLLIDSKKPDEAIGILEKAMNIDTSNGQNYYYLSEAWILKGNKAQATEFNRMAGLYLKDDAPWTLRVRQQKERIERMKGAK